MNQSSEPILQLVRLGLERDTGDTKVWAPAEERHGEARRIRLALLGSESAKEPYIRDIIASNAKTIAVKLQILEHDYKTKVKPDESQRRTAYTSFVTRQSSVARFNPCFRIDDFEELRSALHTILQRQPSDWVKRCRHGRGQTAEGLIGLDKWLTGILVPNLQEELDPLERLNWVRSTTGGLVRASEVIAIPKDQRGPRLIAKEPCGSMLLQQGLMDEIVDRMHRVFPIDNQEQHIRHMLRNSDEVVTVDLSEASDWLSWNLVNQLFPKRWTRVLASLRSPFANVEGHGMVRVGSAFTMGAACCFPILTLVCGLLSQLACLRSGRHITDCSVYGDDIIIHQDAYPYLRFLLACAGLKENSAKSSNGGRMIESCGCDLVDGANVRPVFVRELDTSELPVYVESTLGLQQQLHERGYSSTSELLGQYLRVISCKSMTPARHDSLMDPRRLVTYEGAYEYLESLAGRLRTRVEWSSDMLPGTIWHDVLNTVKRRYNVELGYPQHMGLQVFEETRKPDLSDSGAMAAALLNKRGTLVGEAEPIPGSLRLRYAWQTGTVAASPLKKRIYAFGVGRYL